MTKIWDCLLLVTKDKEDEDNILGVSKCIWSPFSIDLNVVHAISEVNLEQITFEEDYDESIFSNRTQVYVFDAAYILDTSFEQFSRVWKAYKNNK